MSQSQQTMSRSGRVSSRQLDILWEFLDSHRDIATAYNRSLQAKEYSARKWAEVSETLNSQGGGVHKDGRSWSKYWVDYKAKIKKRVAAVRRSQARTGGGPSTEPPLTDIEKKFLGVLGEDFGQGLPGIQVVPFDEPSGITQHVSQDEQPAEAAATSEAPEAVEIEEVETVEVETGVGEAELPHRSPVTSQPRDRPSSHRRRSRRVIPYTREEARRDLVQISRMKAEASAVSAQALERLADVASNIQQTLERIERRMPDASVPRAEQ